MWGLVRKKMDFFVKRYGNGWVIWHEICVKKKRTFTKSHNMSKLFTKCGLLTSGNLSGSKPNRQNAGAGALSSSIDTAMLFNCVISSSRTRLRRSISNKIWSIVPLATIVLSSVPVFSNSSVVASNNLLDRQLLLCTTWVHNTSECSSHRHL